MKVEFLRAWEDHTWDTEVIEVPDEIDKDDGDALITWANFALLKPGNKRYDGLALFAVYNTEPEDPE